MDDSVVFNFGLKRLPHTQAAKKNVYAEWIEFPPLCVNTTNFVTTAKLSERVNVAKIVEKFPFCKIVKENMEKVSLPTIQPYRDGKIYDFGAIGFCGNATFREARVIADQFVDLLRGSSNPDIRIVDFNTSNVGCLMDFDFVLDIYKYNADKPEAIFEESNFGGSRLGGEHKFLVSRAHVTTFKEKINVVSAANERDVCWDIMRLFDEYRKCGHPIGSRKARKILNPPKKEALEPVTKRRRIHL
jgi:hypothetical protein